MSEAQKKEQRKETSCQLNASDHSSIQARFKKWMNYCLEIIFSLIQLHRHRRRRSFSSKILFHSIVGIKNEKLLHVKLFITFSGNFRST